MAKKHLIAVETDDEVNVSVGASTGWWFKVFHSWIDSGWWAEVPPAAAKVLIVLAKHANSERLCWPGLTLLQKETGLPRSSLYAALNQLEAYGLIERRARGYGKKLTVYEIKEPQKRPVCKTVPSTGPVRHARQSDSPDPLSGLRESRLLRRNRSTSEQEEVEPQERAARGGEAEHEAFVAAMTPDERAHAKELVLERQDSTTRMLLAKSSPLQGTLARLIYELFHPKTARG